MLNGDNFPKHACVNKLNRVKTALGAVQTWDLVIEAVGSQPHVCVLCSLWGEAVTLEMMVVLFPL